MVDFILGLALAAMLIRGWLRGFVREALDLVGLVVGIWIAFRLSAPVGDFLVETFAIAPEVGRIGAGILLFILFGLLLSIAAHYLSKVMNLPGLSMVNRVGGAAVAVGWGVTIVLIAMSLIAVLPLPDSWSEALEESTVVSAIAGDDALPRSLFESIAGDDVMGTIASLRDLFGSPRAVPTGTETLDFPAATPDEVTQRREEAEAISDEVNEARISAGLRALTPVGPMTSLAEDHAQAAYTSGSLARIEDCARDLSGRSYQVVRCDNGVALAATAAGGLDGILDTDEGKAMVENPDLDRIGVAVADGPTGRLLVVVVAG